METQYICWKNTAVCVKRGCIHLEDILIYFDSMYVASTCRDGYDKVFYVERQVVYVGRQVVHVKDKVFAWKN